MKVRVTLACAAHLSTLCGENDTICLVIKIQGGGCSGLTYQFGSKPKPEEKDVVLYDMDFVKVVSDSISAHYLDGSLIDYEDLGLNGSGIKVENPNAERLCGCNMSFSPKDHVVKNQQEKE